MKKSKKVFSVALSMLMAFTPVSGLMTLTACGDTGSGSQTETPETKEFTVTFNTNGGSSIASQNVKEGKTVSKPVNPTKADNTFGGWYLDAGCTQEYNFATPVSGNVTLYAKWTANTPAAQEYTVTFNTAGGSAVTTQSVVSGQKATAPADPTKTGYTFAGWYTDAACTIAYDFNTAVTANITVYAKWTESEATQNYTVVFNTNGGSNVVSQTIAEGQKATRPGTPIKSGYSFAGWYTDAACTNEFNFNTPITASITLFAKWNEDSAEETYYTVSFNLNGYGSAIADKEVLDGSTVVLPTNPVDDDMRFVGWYLDEDCTEAFSATTVITGNVTLYAKWVEKGQAATVTFRADYGSAPAAQSVEIGDCAKNPIDKPTDASHIFAGWYIDKDFTEAFDFNTPITQNITLYAKYEEVPDVEKINIRFGGYTVDGTQKATYDKMVAEFNAVYGKYNGISVTNSIVGNWAEYQNRASTALTEADGFDVYMINDRNFKAWAQSRADQIRNIGAGEDFTGDAMFDEQLDNMWGGMIDRFRLNVNGWTSYEDDDLWAVPIDSNPTALYYNRTVLETNGVIVISVEDITVTADNFEELCGKYDGLAEVGLDYAEGERLIDLWNDNLIEDLFLNKHDNLKFVIGSTIEDYNGAEITSDYLETTDTKVPAKGFFRSFTPRNSKESNEYVAPAEGEVLVFNASIAMSWDEVEDIGMICTKNHNDSSKSVYGYYTQWWFCYGWTVGGDCCEDMTGDGTWAFSLSDFTANYMVTEAACTSANPNDANDTNKYYIGQYTGNLYSAGDTLAFLDKIDVEKLTVTQTGTSSAATAGDIVLPNADGSFTKYNVTTGVATQIGKGVNEVVGDTDNSAIRASIRENSSQDQSESGILFVELPSTKEAFSRFAHLCPSDVDDKSIGVSYATSTTTTDETADITKLGNGTVAFVIERGDKLGHLRNVAREYNQSWGVANVPIFKEYVNPDEPTDDTVKRMGVQAGHSECVAISISAGCPDNELDSAWQFIQWMAADYFYLDENGATYFGDQRKPTDVRYRAGQAVKADNGYIPNQPELFESPEENSDRTSFIKAGEENLNLHLFAYAIEYESAGDWWYLPTNTWINEWATSLNAATGVRGGQQTVQEWYNSGIINKTNIKLAEDFNYFYNARNIISQWENHIGADIYW